LLSPESPSTQRSTLPPSPTYQLSDSQNHAPPPKLPHPPVRNSQSNLRPRLHQYPPLPQAQYPPHPRPHPQVLKIHPPHLPTRPKHRPHPSRRSHPSFPPLTLQADLPRSKRHCFPSQHLLHHHALSNPHQLSLLPNLIHSIQNLWLRFELTTPQKRSRKYTTLISPDRWMEGCHWELEKRDTEHHLLIRVISRIFFSSGI